MQRRHIQFSARAEKGILCERCVHTQAGTSVEMENFFSRLTLDIIGKAVFNYDFDSLTHDDPVIQVGPACSCGWACLLLGLPELHCEL